MRYFLFAMVYIGVFILGFAGSYSYLTFAQKTSKPEIITAIDTQIKFHEPVKIDDQKGIFNAVFLGYGGSGHSGSYLTDSIIVIHVNTNTKKAALISIPRDLWLAGNYKINAEATKNGFENIGNPIHDITNLSINYFVSVDFNGFSKLIDTLGGITVDVPKTFDDAFYPISGQENNVCGKTEVEIFELKNKFTGFDLEKQFTCRYEHLHFDKGPVTLDGATALKFVRSRHGDSDFGRSERQFAVLKGIISKSISIKTIETLSKIVRTNLDIETIKNLISVFGNPSEYKLSEIQLTTDNVLNASKSADGQFILIPKAGMFNYSEVHKYLDEFR